MSEESAPHPFQQPSASLPGASPFAAGAKRNRRLIIIGAIAGGFLLIGALLFAVMNSRKGGIIIPEQNPSGWVIRLNNRIVKPKQQSAGLFISAYPGTYRLIITKPDFQPFVKDITVGKNQNVTVRPVFALLPKESRAGTFSIDYVRPSADQKSLFYLGDKKFIYRMHIADRKPVQITTTPLNGVRDVQWSGNPDVALVSDSQGALLQEIPEYDFHQQQQIRLGGTEIISPVWDPNDSRRFAAAYAPSSGERSLIFSTKPFDQFNRQLDISSLTNPKLVWAPDSNSIALINRSPDYAKNDIWLFRTVDGSLTQLTHSGNVTDASFSPSSDTLVYETVANAGSQVDPALNAIKADGSQSKALGINGRVAQAAWRDGNSFFLPDNKSNRLSVYTMDGKKQDLSFAFDAANAVQGMFYFAQSKTLIFYTKDTLYTVNLSI